MYKNLKDCIKDLEKHKMLLRVTEEIDPYLEIAAIHRRVFAKGGPALLFTNVRGTKFPVLTNLFGTLERGRFLFRKTLRSIEALIQTRAHPPSLFGHPLRLFRLPGALFHAAPLPGRKKGVLANECQISELPQIQSWPDDGGPFVTLPQVYSEDPQKPGILSSNLGMYRIQLAGNQYKQNLEVGLHYQIHRGIGIHHARALEQGERLKVSIFIGGPPAHTLAAVMPLPEGLPEVAFAGALAGRNFRAHRLSTGHLISVDADFCITGTIAPQLKPEGPFGDHLGYYSLQHDFPVMEIEHVFYKKNAVWPATMVGRPPAEDTTFGKLIHEITAPMVPASIPGLKEMHAVDAAGVHPLMLAIGSERYTPYNPLREPQELLTIAHAILGFGHASLAKYLFIAASEDAPKLSTHNIAAFFSHILCRVDFSRDLHFQTQGTIDTLDYSAGEGLNRGSKLVLAAVGPPIRKLNRRPPKLALPSGFGRPKMVLPGILAIEAPPYTSPSVGQRTLRRLLQELEKISKKNKSVLSGFPLLLVCDDSKMLSQSLNNFLWATFTRSDPAKDVHGLFAFTKNKHWGCQGPLLMDIRQKPHHAPPLIEDPTVLKAIERFGLPGRSLHGWI